MTTQVSSEYFRDKAKADITIKTKIDESLSEDSRKLIASARQARANRVEVNGVKVHADGRITVKLR